MKVLQVGVSYVFAHMKVMGAGEVDFTCVSEDKNARGTVLGWNVLILAVRGENPWKEFGIFPGATYYLARNNGGVMISRAKPLEMSAS